MKFIKSKIIILVLFILFSPILKINATEPKTEEKRLEMIERISFLIKEVERLKNLILKINTEKDINADSYVVINLLDDSIILEKNIEKKHSIASITKLMSAVITKENINPEKKITLTREMLAPVGYSPSLFLGLSVNANNLLKASIIQSTNDAANSLSYFLKEGDFIKLMNEKAKELGMNNTIFYDSHGLNTLNKSSASDLSKLLKYVNEKHQDIFEISRDNDFWLPDIAGRMLKFKNVNNFYNHPNFIGGKTGYLPEAKQTFVSIFNINETPFIIILLYSNNRQSDTLKIIDFLSKNI